MSPPLRVLESFAFREEAIHVEVRQGRHQVSVTLINTNSTPPKHSAPKGRQDHREGPTSRVSARVDILGGGQDPLSDESAR